MNGRVAAQLDGGFVNSEFDYSSVPCSVARFLKGQADRIRRQCVTSIIQIGKALLEAKHHLSHGDFLSWVESEVGLPARTAQAYMRVAVWASAKGATVAHLQPSALYMLSASSTPKEFAANILDRVEAGEHITLSALRQELKALLESQQERLEPVTPRDPLMDSEQITDATDCQVGERSMNELVAILVRGLSEADFARVRDIATSDVFLSDPQLAKNIEKAFLNCGLSTEAMYVPVAPNASMTH